MYGSKTRLSTSSIDWYSRRFSDFSDFSNRNYLWDLEKFRKKKFYEYLNVYNFSTTEPFRKRLYGSKARSFPFRSRPVSF